MSKGTQSIRNEIEEIKKEVTNVLEKKTEILIFSINVAISKIEKIRNKFKDENLWREGISALKLLYRARKKQDEVTLKILSGDLEYFGPNYKEFFLELLNNEEKLRNIGLQLYRTQKINQTIPNLDLDYNEQLLAESVKNSSIEVETVVPEEKPPEIKVPDTYKSVKFKETLNELYRLLKKKKKLPLLESILTDSFLKTFLRIQCISFLFNYSYVKLNKASEDEHAKAGKWMIVDSSAFPDLEEEVSTSIIIGLSYNNWKKLQPFLKKNDFENRPEISTID